MADGASSAGLPPRRRGTSIALICIGGLILLSIGLVSLRAAVLHVGSTLELPLWAGICILAGIGLLGWGLPLSSSSRRTMLLLGGAFLIMLPPGLLFGFVVAVSWRWNDDSATYESVAASMLSIVVLTVVGALVLIYWGMRLRRR